MKFEAQDLEASKEPIEDDEERLAMKQGDMPPPVPERVANPRIRDDRAAQEFQSNSDKMHRATSDDAFTQAWLKKNAAMSSHNP